MKDNAEFVTNMGYDDEDLADYANFYLVNKPLRLIMSKRDKVYAKNYNIYFPTSYF